VEGRERSLSVINDERDLHIDLAQNTLQSRLVQHLVTSTSSPTKISLSFFIHLSLTSARDTKKKKKLAGFRWLAGLRFVEVCINAYLQPLLLQPDVKRKKKKKKKKANDRAQQQSKQSVIATLRRNISFTRHRSNRERERKRRETSPERAARGIRSSSRTLFFSFIRCFVSSFRVFL